MTLDLDPPAEAHAGKRFVKDLGGKGFIASLDMYSHVGSLSHWAIEIIGHA